MVMHWNKPVAPTDSALICRNAFAWGIFTNKNWVSGQIRGKLWLSVGRSDSSNMNFLFSDRLTLRDWNEMYVPRASPVHIRRGAHTALDVFYAELLGTLQTSPAPSFAWLMLARRLLSKLPLWCRACASFFDLDDILRVAVHHFSSAMPGRRPVMRYLRGFSF